MIGKQSNDNLITFRDLRPEEIVCRVVKVEKDCVKLLLCRDPRTDMAILDETVGSDNWQSCHYGCGDDVYCRVGINVNYRDSGLQPTFIWKSDGAEKRYESDVKGQASESFQRACVQWGIGRELYSSQSFLIRGVNTAARDGKPVVIDRFRVKSISIENKKITAIEIERIWRDENGTIQCSICFSKGMGQNECEDSDV